MIFTDHVLEIYDILKGGINTQNISFTTKGGTLGNNKIEIDGLLNPKLNDKGVYYLQFLNNKYLPLKAKKEIDYYFNNLVYTPYGTLNVSDYKRVIAKIMGAPNATVTYSSTQSKKNENNKAVAVIDSLYPISITAGTGSVLTIEGAGFGFVRGNGKVLFTSTSPGEPIIVEPYPSQYISWNDTLIQVEVPSRTYSGAGVSAGTGYIKVLSDTAIGNDVTSSDLLQITYSRYNISNAGLQKPKFKDDNNTDGYTFVLDSNIHNNINANEAFQRSLETWRCATNVNWIIGSPINSPVSILDGNSVIKFADLDPWNISITTKYYIQCGGDWYVEEVDIDMNDSLTWNYGAVQPQANEWDFQSEMTLALGLAHMLARSNEVNSVMHYAYNLGETYRTLGTGDINCGNYVMTQSLSAPGCALGPMTIIPTCQVGFDDDAAPVVVLLPLENSCNGNLPVRVSIRNPGLNNLISTQINWSINGTPQTPYSWTGNLANGDTSLPIELGFYNFPVGIASIGVNTIFPNGNSDQQTANDSAFNLVGIISCGQVDARISWPIGLVCLGYEPVIVDISNWTSGENIYNCVIQWEIDGILQPPYYMVDTIVQYDFHRATLGYYNFSISGMQLKAWIEYPNGLLPNGPAGVDTINYTFTPSGLSGTYTVGGINPDYTDLSTAFSAINDNGLCAPVTMNIRPGTYDNIVTLAVRNTRDPSAANTLIFQAENGDSSSVIITRLNGLNRTIRLDSIGYTTFNKVTFKTSTFDSPLVVLRDPRNHISFTNCAFIGNGTSFNPFNSVAIESSVEGNPTNLEISNCYFTNVQNGIVIRSFDSVTIFNNTFDSIHNSPMLISEVKNLNLTKNYKTWARFSQILLNNCMESLTVTNNEFHNSEFTFRNIIMPNGSSAKINNNIFDATNYSAVVFSSNISNIDFIHNTVVSTQTAAFNYFQNGIYSSIGVRFFNNIFSGSGSTFILRNSTDLIESNGNCFYPNQLNIGNFSAYTLQQFQSLTGLDTNSINVNPQLNTNSDNHFQLQTNNYQLADGGVSTYIYNDINGNLRSVNPTIGADEITVLIKDAEALMINIPSTNCDSSSVEFSFRNSGANLITSLTINWSVDGILQPSYNWSGFLFYSLTSGMFSIGGYNFQPNNNYAIKIWTENPNGLPDLDNSNDTLTFNLDYTINVNLGSDTVVCSGDSFVLGLNDSFSSYLWSDSSFDSTLTIVNAGNYWCTATNTYGCYDTDTINIVYYTPTVVSMASFNPSIVCISDSSQSLPSVSPLGGFFSGNGVVGSSFDPATAGAGTHSIMYSFTDSNLCTYSDSQLITVSLCTGIETVINDGEVLIYPNPNHGQFSIVKSNDFNKEVDVKLFDVTSKVIIEKTILKGTKKLDIDISKYSVGVYYLQLLIEDKIYMKKVVKN